MKLPRLSSNEIIKIIEKKGFILVRQSGSHKIYRSEKGIRLTVPFHSNKVLHPKIIKSIMKDAEISEDDIKK